MGSLKTPAKEHQCHVLDCPRPLNSLQGCIILWAGVALKSSLKAQYGLGKPCSPDFKAAGTEFSLAGEDNL